MGEGATELANTGSQTTQSGMDIMMSWIMTPTGATLFLLLCACGLLKVIKRGSRVASVAVSVAAGLFFVWIVGGVLQAWGIPVRDWLQQLGAQLPDLGSAVGRFFTRMFSMAG